MTPEASDMRIESRRNRHSDSAATRPMTSRATNAAHAYVARMIEFHVEAAETRKCFQSPGLRIAMANRADCIRRVGKLLYVTAGARQVIRASGNCGTRRIGVAFMTK